MILDNDTLKIMEGMVENLNTRVRFKLMKEPAYLLAAYQLGHHSSRKECPCHPCKWATEILKEFTALDRIEVKGDEHERRATGSSTAIED